MATFDLGDGNSLLYEYTPPSVDPAVTFVFFNALTGDVNMWLDNVAKPLHDAGHGTLVYNMRGQRDSPYSADLKLDQQLIVSDAVQLLAHVSPPNPVFAGLSIGGIFAARAVEQGAQCAGLVLINTLRRDGARLQWINDAVVRLAEVGGPDLLRDIMSPLLMNEAWQAENRSASLTGDSYTPIDTDSGTYNLLSSARTTDWDFPYEQLTMPVLVITGTQDRVFRDPADVERLFARLPNARRLDLEDAGHMIPVEQPEALGAALLDMAKLVST